ncbi:Uncharacterised protein [Lactiplantibacillus plantarum subsp. plantarum]|nr:Uncharacterised protein [Lactiplantibacillus plantarum subsp. plantarum]
MTTDYSSPAYLQKLISTGVLPTTYQLVNFI